MAGKFAFLYDAHIVHIVSEALGHLPEPLL